ncbi:hypothetical protein LWI28_005404 [Acer negundo]|uniref:Uncharacterized protein n=1 Tax=Acer negundo TaxID=4023 RepID=A0AAD5NUV6_ACENE|nr:hypothetical protein LWI28_005404 [Acer negundo]
MLCASCFWCRKLAFSTTIGGQDAVCCGSRRSHDSRATKIPKNFCRPTTAWVSLQRETAAVERHLSDKNLKTSLRLSAAWVSLGRSNRGSRDLVEQCRFHQNATVLVPRLRGLRRLRGPKRARTEAKGSESKAEGSEPKAEDVEGADEDDNVRLLTQMLKVLKVTQSEQADAYAA